MNEHYSDEIPFKNILEGTSTLGYIHKTINFLEKYLPEFPQYFKSKGVLKASEEDISEYLYSFLQRKRRYNQENIEYPFEFQTEASQRQRAAGKKGHKRRIDIGVRINTFDIDMELIYCLEAKRLPTDRIGSDREKEYVTGNYGGINRFKKSQHGVNSQGEPIRRNGIVGYIQSLNAAHWHKQINSWISNDTDWGSEELLNIKNIGSFSKLESSHKRSGGGEVNLSHYWLMMN